MLQAVELPAGIANERIKGWLVLILTMLQAVELPAGIANERING
jgi:hypothetical protein